MPNQPQQDKTKVKKTPTETDIYCRRCRCVNSSQNKTCDECNARLEVGTESAKCVKCGEKLQTNARYCIKYDCGADQRVFEPPVAWLLGRQLIASFKSTLVYTAFGTKIDARDWMDAKVYSFDRQASGQARETFKKLYPDQPESAPVELVIAEPAQEESWRQKDEFWFDYISDTGDGMKATYSIAYLSLSNLWVSAALAARAEAGTSNDNILRGKIAPEILKKRTSPEYLEEREKKRKAPRGENSVELDHEVETGEGELKQLPRGEFLLVGGDTCYHLSDYASLHTRFQTPFDWAYRDLDEDLQKVNRRIDNVDDRATGKNRRPLFGIPGNHDYYDMLDGFRRQFRLPVRSRSEDKVYSNDDLSAAQLMSRGFKRLQQASYLALRLPFKWMLWGLDTEVGRIDERQRDFFNSVRGRGTPERLIVATSAPTTVFGKTASRDDEKSSRAFFQLNLRRCFLPRSKWEEDEKKKWQENGSEVLDPSQIRLDLSGDVHQYARYWGPTGRTSHLARPDNATAKLEEAPNYASVVSGLGGAFHHPSTTFVNEVREQALYPSEDESRKAVAKVIFNPIKVFKGGGIWVVGGVIALLLTFAAIVGESSRPAIHNLIPFTAFNLTEPERYQLTVATAPTPEPTPASQQAMEQLRPQRGSQSLPVPGQPSSPEPPVRLQPDKVVPSIIWRSLGVAGPTWKPEFAAIQPDDAGCKDGTKFLWGKCSVKWPPDFLIGMVLLLSTVGVIIVTFVLSERAYKKSQRQDEANKLKPKPPEEQAKDLRDMVRRVNFTLWFTFFINICLAIVGVFSIMPYRDFITPFGNSLWVLLTIIWAVTSIIFSIRYSDWLFEQASKRKVGNRDWVITFGLSIATVVSLAVGLGLFGTNNLPAYLVSDILFVTVVLATFFLLLYAAFSMGGQFQRGWKKAGMLFIGFFHWLLQLGVALLLIKKGTWLTVALALLVVLGFIKVGKYLMSENQRWRWKLLIAWVVFGGIILGLPPLIYQILRPYWEQGWVKALFFPHVFKEMPGSFASYEWWGGGWWNSLSPWWFLIPLVIASVFGALLSCVWVGWYFAVCLGFNGHNNEAGGASRIEHFKQFIRFRLRPNDLTGYVIAIDDPEEDGGKLEPKLIDIFHLKAIEPSESKNS